MKRTLVPIVSAGAIVALVAGVAGVKAFTEERAQEFSTTDGAPSAASDAVQARANEIFESFNGSVRQRDASGVLQAWSLNGAMDKCMGGQGFPEWDWSATRNMAPRTDALGTSVFFSAPLSRSYSLALMDMVEATRAEQRLRSETLTPEEDAAVGTCLESTPVTSDAAAASYSTPPAAEKLRSEWWSMLASLDDKAYGDLSAYGDCFHDGSEDLSGDLGVTGDGWKQRLAQLAPSPAQTPTDVSSPLSTAPAWKAFIQVEAQLETVDWTCRASTYESHLGEVETAMISFEDDHAREIEQAQSEWRMIEQRAFDLGFHGQVGSLD